MNNFFSLALCMCLGFNLWVLSGSAQTVLIPGPERIFKASTNVANVYIPPQAGYQNKAASANIVVNFSANFPSNAKSAFDFAAQLWAQSISSSVTIYVDANWTSLGANVLGSASATQLGTNSNMPQPQHLYPIALVNKYSGTDQSPNQADIVANFNSDYTNFYFGTDGNGPVTQYDFATIVFHELAHGLGFFSSVAQDPATLNYKLGYNIGGNSYLYVLDSFISNSGGTSISSFGVGAHAQNSALGNFVTNDNLFFTGWNAHSANGYNNPEWFAPSIWNQGSSLSHFNESYFPIGNVNSLMTPSLALKESIHTNGPVCNGVMKDIGWIDAQLITGMNDEMEILGYVNNSPATSPVTTLGLNTDYYYQMEFMDNAPYTSPPSQLNWECQLFAGDGLYIIESSSQYYFNLNINNVNLPNKEWTRNIDGTIAGRIKLQGVDGDGYGHSYYLPIKVEAAPNVPEIKIDQIFGGNKGCENAEISFYSSFTNDYVIEQNCINCTGGINNFVLPVQGNQFTAMGLDETKTYSFSVSAINSFGVSNRSGTINRNNCTFIISIYPNPILNYHEFVNVDVEGDTQIGRIELIDISNPENVIEFAGNGEQHVECPIAGLPGGVYTLIVYNIENMYVGEVVLKME